MEFIAQSKSVTISPRKVRLVADQIRKTNIEDARRILSGIDKRAVRPLQKTLQSALANATRSGKVSEEKLIVKAVEVSQEPALKRFHPSTRGRTHPYKKRRSNIKIILEEKNDGTKN